MDLNNLRAAAPQPEPRPLRIVRLGRTDGGPLRDLDAPGLEVFDGGEALPESQGESFPLPISDEEREALEREGYDVGDAMTQLRQSVADNPDIDGQIRALAQDALIREEEKKAQAAYEAQQAEQAAIEAAYYSRHCPLPTCDAIARVPKGRDEGDILGLGMSMAAATQLEELLLEHLQSHSFGDWIAALKAQQETIDALGRSAFAAPAAGIVRQESLVSDPGIIPGPARRSPEREAAVRALDARLGSRATSPVPPEDVEAHDRALRELRARRRAQREMTPYDLTPRWSADLENGVVGIKR